MRLLLDGEVVRWRKLMTNECLPTPVPGTIRETRKFLVHPDDIKRLSVGEAIVVTKQSSMIDAIQARRSHYCE